MPSSAETRKGLVWSTSSPSDEVLIRAALLKPRYHAILNMVLDFSFDRVANEWDLLTQEGTSEAIRATPYVSRILRNIQQGIRNAQARNG